VIKLNKTSSEYLAEMFIATDNVSSASILLPAKYNTISNKAILLRTKQSTKLFYQHIKSLLAYFIPYRLIRDNKTLTNS